jgi:uncharacterized SAM-binding protein YcdF (DUF218 family)
MYYYVEKILQKALWPETIALVVLIFAWLCLRRGKNRYAKFGLLGAFLILFIPSLPFLANSLVGHIEGYYPTRPIGDYPPADVIVVLGGSTGFLQPPRQEPEEISGSRILPAARLYRAGKAKFVMACGGLPYRDTQGKMRTMADDISDILVEEGVPRSAILLEDRSKTTREDALYAGQILREKGFKTALLVTSAFHLKRATRLFKATGTEIIPVPVGHEVTRGGLHFDSFFPDARALYLSTLAWKECVGYFVDWVFSLWGGRRTTP